MRQPSSPGHYTLKKPRPKKRGPDSALLGLIIGILFPFIAVAILYFVQFSDYSPGRYFGMFFQFGNPVMMEQSSKVVSLSMISNLIPFYYFLNRRLYLTTRGVIIATILSFVLIILYKYVWQ